MTIKILLVDDQPIFRQGLASLLRLQEDFEVVGEAGDGKVAIALAAELQPNVVLMDVRMPVCNGVEATREIHQRFPWMQILVLTTFDEDDYVFQSLEVGALGYLLKSTPTEQIASAIRSVHQGYSQLGPTIAPKVFSQVKAPDEHAAAALAGLRDRDLQILRLLGQGQNNKEISTILHLTEGTVKNHLTNIFIQLDVRDRTQAALWVQANLPG